MERPWQDADTLHSLYWVECLTATEIAERLDCDKSTVGRWLDKHNIEKRSKPESIALGTLPKETFKKVTDSDWLREKYHGQGLSVSEIASELDCSNDTVHQWLIRHDIDRRSEGNRKGENSHCWKGEELTRICEVCGDEFRTKNSEVGRFCGMDCKAEWQSVAYRGETNPSYNGGRDTDYGPNWDEQRSKALNRDNYTCQRCGMDEDKHREKYGRGLDVHHISHKKNFDEYEKMNELSNLISLCVRCHKLLERLPIDTGDR
jgi:transposase-like protein/5-methylcytosine-specific restriction endonuclease McrA